jgi:dinuclear metal center YbgI/SA1388 family protein
MIKIKDIISELERFAPLSFQEDYDNAGLIVGNSDQICNAVILTIDATEDIVDEAIKKGANLIVAHHPIVFSGLRKITGQNYIEKTLIKAIKNDVAIYASHTNMDAIIQGVNKKVCEKMKLNHCRILRPAKDKLKKLVSFVPLMHIDKIREAVLNAGAGHIGLYDSCSFSSPGKGSFRALEGTNPFVGEKGILHFEDEIRFETVFPENLQKFVIQALISNHPYEEVAYDIYPLDNEYYQAGSGMIGELANPMNELVFLANLKQIFNVKMIKHTEFLNKGITKIAVCGGSGSFLLNDAMKQNADVFISSDFKYHQFFDAEKRILIADIGHYESEQFTKELFYDILTKKFPNFAFYFSEVNTNPVHYF